VAATLPGYEVIGWFGLVAPLATSGEIVTRLNAEVKKALARKDVREKFAVQGLTPAADTPQQYNAFIKSETVKWGKLIKDANINVK